MNIETKKNIDINVSLISSELYNLAKSNEIDIHEYFFNDTLYELILYLDNDKSINKKDYIKKYLKDDGYTFRESRMVIDGQIRLIDILIREFEIFLIEQQKFCLEKKISEIEICISDPNSGSFEVCSGINFKYI